ncbi:MAG TPA: glycosyltransferase family 9 protein [Candidatus Polarisedimenticolaceae bacterium]|nr:glycosyltransferase family 9 protein [Candidatus Polarisedimenticolaceae bacterium]
MRVESRLVQVALRGHEVRTPGEPIEGVERLLVVRNDRLGDLLLTLPAIDALARTYPGARVGLLVGRELSDIGGMIRPVERLFAVERRAQAVRGAIEAFAPQLVVAISRRPAPAWAAARAGVPHRVGTGYRYYSPLFTRRVDERRRSSTRHEVEYALSFAHRAGARPAEPDFSLRVPGEARERVAAWLSGRGLADRFAIVHPGTGGSCPAWPLPHYRTLVASLAALGHAVVVTVGPDDREIVDGWERAGAEGSVACFRQSTPLLAALVERAALVVSNSTAPIHLAAALGRPALALHAPWPSCGPDRWGPYHRAGWALVAESTGAAGWSRRERECKATVLMAGIAPERVLQAVVSMLGTGRPV